MTFESESDRLAILTGLGGTYFSAPVDRIFGVLETDYVGVGEVAVDDYQPRLTVRSSDVSRCEIVAGSELETDDESYAVRSLQPDGQGMTVLVLEVL